MRAKMLRGRGAAGRDRRGRHRRRRLRLATTSRPAPPSSSPAPACRSPSTATARCRRSRARPTCSARSASRSTSTPEQVGALHPRGRHRLHVRAGASSGDEACRPDPRRARHPHHLQSARAAVQSGGRQAPDGRRVLPALGRADGAGAGEPRLRARLGGARLRRARRDHDRRARPASRRSKNGGCAPSRSRRRMSACSAPSRRRCAAATPTHNAEALRDVLEGKPGPVPRRRAPQRRRRAGRRRQGQGS